MRPYGTKLVKECVDRVKNGERVTDVARDVGVSNQAVSKWCNDVGIRSSKAHQWTNEEAQKFAEMWSRGMTYREISDELGLSVSSLYSYAERHRAWFPRRSHGGIRYDKARVQALEKENAKLRELCRGREKSDEPKLEVTTDAFGHVTCSITHDGVLLTKEQANQIALELDSLRELCASMRRYIKDRIGPPDDECDEYGCFIYGKGYLTFDQAMRELGIEVG